MPAPAPIAPPPVLTEKPVLAEKPWLSLSHPGPHTVQINKVVDEDTDIALGDRITILLNHRSRMCVLF